MRTMLIILVLLATAATARADDLAHQRALQIQRLRAYVDAGVFPADPRGAPLSVFRDARGRLCPMAHLIAASGRGDLVDHVARTNNRLRLAEVRRGPVWDWMQRSGLRRDEIIRIQGVMSFQPQLELELWPTNLQRVVAIRLRRIIADLERTPGPATTAEFQATRRPRTPDRPNTRP